MTEDDPRAQYEIDIQIPDGACLDDIKHQLYDELIASLGAPPTCLPDHGVHVYPDHRGDGPCACRRQRTSQPPPTSKGAR